MHLRAVLKTSGICVVFQTTMELEISFMQTTDARVVPNISSEIDESVVLMTQYQCKFTDAGDHYHMLINFVKIATLHF